MAGDLTQIKVPFSDKLMRDLVERKLFLEENKIPHNDIKPANFLVNTTGEVKCSDLDNGSTAFYNFAQGQANQNISKLGLVFIEQRLSMALPEFSEIIKSPFLGDLTPSELKILADLLKKSDLELTNNDLVTWKKSILTKLQDLMKKHPQTFGKQKVPN